MAPALLTMDLHGGSMKILALSLLILTSLSARAQMPPYASIKSVEIDGSGCEAGSANALMTSDLNFLSVLYDRFSVEIGSGTANPGSRAMEKNCTINVMVQVPPGWNFQFDSADYRGYVEVPNRMTLAYQVITAEVYGGRGIAFDQNLIRGPKRENFATTVRNKGIADVKSGNNALDRIGGIIGIIGGIRNTVNNISSGALSGCSSEPQDVKIKIKSLIGVRNLLADISKPAVKIVIDSTDASFRQNLRLRWNQCR